MLTLLFCSILLDRKNDSRIILKPSAFQSLFAFEVKCQGVKNFILVAHYGEILFQSSMKSKNLKIIF